MTLEIRLAREDDKNNVLKLLNSVFERQQRSAHSRDDRYWDWKFLQSPFGRSILSVAEIGHEIVGVDNLWPWEFNFLGNTYCAFQPCDSVVHPNFRGQGIFKKLRLHGLEIAKGNKPAFLFNFPNNQSLRTNLSLGWHHMGLIPWYVSPLQPLRVFAGIACAGRTESLNICDNYKLDVVSLEIVNKKNPFPTSYVGINRKAGYYDWRYVNHPMRHYGMILTERGNYSTSAIFTVNKRGSLNEMFIVELLGSPEIASDLLRDIISAAKEMDISLLAMMKNSLFFSTNVWQYGFIQMKSKNMVVFPLFPDLNPIVKDFKNWSMNACIHDSL